AGRLYSATRIAACGRCTRSHCAPTVCVQVPPVATRTAIHIARNTPIRSGDQVETDLDGSAIRLTLRLKAIYRRPKQRPRRIGSSLNLAAELLKGASTPASSDSSWALIYQWEIRTDESAEKAPYRTSAGRWPSFLGWSCVAHEGSGEKSS